VWCTTADGERVHGLWLRAAEPAFGHVLFCHGNAGDVTDRLPYAVLLAAAGLDVLLFDYRGYGRSSGRPSEEGTHADARAAREALLGRQGVDPARLLYLGESLGGAVALRLAATHDIVAAARSAEELAALAAEVEGAGGRCEALPLDVADVIDSGLTLSWLLKNMASRGPASVEVVALLRKPDAAKVEVPVKYVGCDIPTEFVVGYGLDYAERYRDLPFVGLLRPEVYAARP